MKNLVFYFKNITSSIPLVIIEIYFAVLIITGKSSFLFLVLLTILFGYILNYLLSILWKISSTDTSKRPSECGYCDSNKKTTCIGCGLYMNPHESKKNNSPGMPSFHAQVVGLSVTFWTIYIVINDPSPVKIFKIFVLLSIFFVTCCERTAICCESTGQVSAGAGFGVIFGIVMYYTSKELGLIDDIIPSSSNKSHYSNSNKYSNKYSNNGNSINNINKFNNK